MECFLPKMKNQTSVFSLTTYTHHYMEVITSERKDVNGKYKTRKEVAIALLLHCYDQAPGRTGMSQKEFILRHDFKRIDQSIIAGKACWNSW